MNLAYLILAHRRPQQVANLINRLNNNNTDFYVHVDKKSQPHYHEFISQVFKLVSYKEKVFFTKKNINVKWGGFTFSKAIFHLLEDSFMKNKYDYYSLLSVQDYPIKPHEYIIEHLTTNYGKSLIEFSNYSDISLKINRLNRYYFYDYYIKNLNLPQTLNLPQRILTKILPKRKVKFTPFFGRCWWFLYKDAVSYILDMNDTDNSIIKFHKSVLLPEETLFPSLLCNSDLKNTLINTRTTEADYSKSHPKVIDKNDIEKLLDSQAFFARKFDYDLDLFHLIDEKVHQKYK